MMGAEGEISDALISVRFFGRSKFKSSASYMRLLLLLF
jgi:hypothetical protein